VPDITRSSAVDRIRALEDELLAVRCQLGEPGAFDALIDRWHQPLWTYGRRVTGSDDATHDLIQDVWIRVLRGVRTLREPAHLRAWLFGITRRVLMDRLRAQYAGPMPGDVDPDTLPQEAADGEADAEADEARLLDGLADLPVVEREALTLFYLRELSLAEIAALLDVPVGTVKSRLHRARRMLRRELESAAGR
jgi:RNA polymerase sigma factor (sigma-70 family)